MKIKNKLLKTEENLPYIECLSFPPYKGRILFSNGCYDIIHIGHISLFRKMYEEKYEDDIIIIAINNDESIKKLKGENRPINSLEYRITMLSAIEYIDYIIPFNQTSILPLLKILKPDILFKGGSTDIIEGKEYVESYGGKVVKTDFIENYSSTKIAKLLEIE